VCPGPPTVCVPCGAGVYTPSESFCRCTSSTWDCAPPAAGQVQCPSPVSNADFYVDPSCSVPYGADAGPDAGYEGAPDDGSVETGAGDGGSYTGAILALVGVPGPSPFVAAYDVQAGFSAFAENIEFLYPTTTPNTGCSCTHGIGIGDPGPEELSAGTITVTVADGGPVLAALMPTGTTFVYGEASASAWGPGEVLAVSAQGYPGQVKAFSTTLQTAAPFSGVMPAIGAAPVTILLSADFSVSWTPQAKANEFVSLSINQTSTLAAAQCTCNGPESVGTITVPASSLADYFAPSSSGSSSTASATVYLTRTVISTVLTETATVYLIGRASLYGGAEFQ
jgi:hypothetical protein